MKDGLVEIFRAGTYTPNSGEPMKFSPAEVEAIAASYDPSVSEAPIVVGHPKDNSPAYGWVESLKAQGGRLLAKFKQVDQGFREAVNASRFKHRSISLRKNPDGRGYYLRHVGFLGAAPPAVKGMRPVPANFEEGDAIAFEFSDVSVQGKELDMDREGLTKVIDDRLANFAERLKKMFGRKEDAVPADFSEQIKAAVAKQSEAMEAAFSEKIKTLEADLKAEREAREQAQQDSVSPEIRSFVEAKRAEGKWVPAMDKMGLAEFADALGGLESIDFSEGEGDEKKTVERTPLEIFKNFIEGLPKMVDFEELTDGAGKARAAGKLLHFTAPDARTAVEGFELAERAAVIEKERKVPYGEALDQARAEMA